MKRFCPGVGPTCITTEALISNADDATGTRIGRISTDLVILASGGPVRARTHSQTRRSHDPFNDHCACG
jgi:hypothetical protein